MDSHQAREILLLYREGIDPATDPEIAEALGRVRDDAELGERYRHHLDLQTKLRAGFQQIAVPEGLKEQIISERPTGIPIGTRRKVVFAALAAVTACLVLAAVLFLQMTPGENNRWAGFRIRMSSMVTRAYPKMDKETDNLAEIQTYLAGTSRGGYSLPHSLEQTTGTGCKALTWQGKPVAMICFKSVAATKAPQPDLFLFVIDQAAVPDPAAATASDAVQIGKLATISWSQNGKMYLLGALGTQAKKVQDNIATEVKTL